MKESQFKLETFPGKAFLGFTKGEEWNGWACPYFDFKEAKRITGVHSETLNVKAWYNEEKDSFVFELQDETEEYPVEIISGQKLYPIGSGVWIWEEAE